MGIIAINSMNMNTVCEHNELIYVKNDTNFSNK